MSGHTPGKLSFAGPSKPTLDTPRGVDFAILDQGGKIIAETFAQVDYTEMRPAGTNAKRFVQTWNAHDDLLAELGITSKILSKVLAGGDMGDATRMILEWKVKELDAAIAKATGEPTP